MGYLNSGHRSEFLVQPKSGRHRPGVWMWSNSRIQLPSRSPGQSASWPALHLAPFYPSFSLPPPHPEEPLCWLNMTSTVGPYLPDALQHQHKYLHQSCVPCTVAHVRDSIGPMQAAYISPGAHLDCAAHLWSRGLGVEIRFQNAEELNCITTQRIH